VKTKALMHDNKAIKGLKKSKIGVGDEIQHPQKIKQVCICKKGQQIIKRGVFMNK